MELSPYDKSSMCRVELFSHVVGFAHGSRSFPPSFADMPLELRVELSSVVHADANNSRKQTAMDKKIFICK
ncbi:MAG: hypothetical protein LBI81_01740 [Puniceicoccales bacterium]|nr:hypothetical protein [Puniceicoccales bacterium]